MLDTEGKKKVGKEEIAQMVVETKGGPSRRALFWRRVFGNKILIVGMIIVFFFIFIVLLAPNLSKYDPTKMDFSVRFAPPSFEHLMGTDNFGRDTFARIIYGSRVSFKVGVIALMIGMVGGILLGAAGGYMGGLVDELLMRIMDALLAFPPLLLAVGLVAAVGPSLLTVAVVIGVVFIPRFARVMRSSVLAEREKEYVEAARAIGQSNLKILVKHIGPSTISPVIVLGTIVFALAIIIEAVLGFLGLGVPPPRPSWGTMLDEARRFLDTTIWMALWPGLSISFAVMGFNLLGDGLRDFLDPNFYTMTKTTVT